MRVVPHWKSKGGEWCQLNH